MRLHTDDLYLSAVTIAEITAGIAKLQTTGKASRADALQVWLDGIAAHYADRVLPIDIAVARVAGIPSERARSAGHAPGMADLLIAATAECRGDGLLTVNVRHFEPLNLSVLMLNPLRDPLPARRDR